MPQPADRSLPLQAAVKRYKVTGSGKVMVRKPGKQHINEKKSPNRLSRLGKKMQARFWPCLAPGSSLTPPTWWQFCRGVIRWPLHRAVRTMRRMSFTCQGRISITRCSH